MPTEILAIALNLARNCHFPVFPCLANKRPATPALPNGQGGFHLASTDPAVIRELWARYPGPLIGVPTGPASDTAVLDADIYKQGKDGQLTRGWLEANAYRLPPTRIHATRSRGLHHCFRDRPGLTCSASLIAPGIDVRASGGYFIFWPAAGLEVVSHERRAPWPAWLDEALANAVAHRARLAREAQAAAAAAYVASGRASADMDHRHAAYVARLLATLGAAAEGAKHCTLLRCGRALGGVMAAYGLSETAAVELLVGALPATVIDWDNARRTARDGLAAGRKALIALPDRHANSGRAAA